LSFAHHDLSKEAKDIGSCAVLISLILIFIVHIHYKLGKIKIKHCLSETHS